MQAWNRENTQYIAALQIDAIAIGKGPIRRYIRTLPHWNYARIESRKEKKESRKERI